MVADVNLESDVIERAMRGKGIRAGELASDIGFLRDEVSDFFE